MVSVFQGIADYRALPPQNTLSHSLASSLGVVSQMSCPLMGIALEGGFRRDGVTYNGGKRDAEGRTNLKDKLQNYLSFPECANN